ncbi:PDZ domain-containing protein [Carnobacterium divergens]|uniref:hypothetical protein n=1 Tax=Carnobacterium divergens TaxID=2748 RepID=UPI00128D2793|nr:hypothetical protein [Carnobacterium divergens]MPQ22290.1 hypothetical protein [Carnobacterium divergens]
MGEWIKTIVMIVGLFFIQPLFIIGIIWSIGMSLKRIRTERKTYRVAIFKEWFEVKNFLLMGLLPGVVVSSIVTIIGVPLTIEWIICYQLSTIILLILFGTRYIHPIITFPVTALLLIVANGILETNSSSGLNLMGYHIDQLNFFNDHLLINGLVVMFLTLLVTIFSLRFYKMKQLSPEFLKTSRGKWVGSYFLKPFWVFPLLTIVPGSLFTAVFDWWPVFSIGNQTYTVLFLPILIGLQLKVQAQIPQQSLNLVVKDLMIVTGVLVGLIGLNIVWPAYTWISYLVIFIGAIVVYLRHRKREHSWSFLYGTDDEGLKVLGIRPETPAAKMKLTVGDTIVTCNDLPIKTEDDFYQALKINSAYCHLKIKQIDGEYRLEQTAIYEDSPHEIGVVTIPEKLI